MSNTFRHSYDSSFKAAVAEKRITAYYEGICENLQKEIGLLLAELRQQKLMTQEQLSRRLHYSVSCISALENGKLGSDYKKLCALCQEYGVLFPDLIEVAYLNCLFNYHCHKEYYKLR